jgi:glutamyl-tRNA reductase
VFFVDISVPRNIDPEIAGLDNVFLFDIDDLDSVVKSNIREREQEAGRAEIIIDDEVQALVQQLRALDIGPAVVEVKELLLHIVLNEFKRNRKRLGDLSPAQETAIEDVLIPALVNKLSHPMIVHLRNAAGTGKPSQMVEELRKMIRID